VISAAHRRYQGQLVAGGQPRLGVRVVAVDGHPHGHPLQQIPQLRAAGELVERLSDRRILLELHLDGVLTGALAQDRE
jgi:hypothetical protein